MLVAEISKGLVRFIHPTNGLISNQPILSHDISEKSNINHHTQGKKTKNLSTTTQDIVEGISVRNWSGKRGYIGRKMKAVFYFDYSTLKCSNIVAKVGPFMFLFPLSARRL